MHGALDAGVDHVEADVSMSVLNSARYSARLRTGSRSISRSISSCGMVGLKAAVVPLATSTSGAPLGP